MPLNREQWLANVELRGAAEIPISFVVSGASWLEHRGALADLLAQYADIVPNAMGPDTDWDEYARGSERAGKQVVDRWGCRWDHAYDGLTGQVVGHPLADWDALDDFTPPDPAVEGDMGDIDWDEIARSVEAAHERGEAATCFAAHGFFFMRLYYLRGFENLMTDVALDEPRLDRLIDMVVEFNMGLIDRFLACGPEVISFGDDMGTQTQLQISPPSWRRYVKPAYAKMFGRVREAGAHVFLHSDGHISEIFDDLVEIGVSIVNPQDLCNGLETIKDRLQGRVCVDLDVDRQSVVPFGTPAEIDRHVRTCIETLGSPQGGLQLTCGVYPPTPIANIRAVLEAFRRYRGMFAGE